MLHGRVASKLATLLSVQEAMESIPVAAEAELIWTGFCLVGPIEPGPSAASAAIGLDKS